jgi:hypothetical protein
MTAGQRLLFDAAEPGFLFNEALKAVDAVCQETSGASVRKQVEQ